MNFERLLFLREEKDLRQIDIANILKVNRVNISNWEHGKEIIPIDKLNIYANYFNTSMDYILKINDNRKKITDNNSTLDKSDIGKRLKEIRTINKITQKDLAKILNTTQSTISDYENGVNLILTSFAYQICVKYNISMDWLCGRKK